MIRLDKYLADMGIGTRQEVKKYIRQGRVTIDGEIMKKPEYKVDESSQQVCMDHVPVGYAEYEYFMLNKPAGVISATEDKMQKTVIDLLEDKKRKDLFPVGRLDKDTEGLLLITNDGELSHALLSPKKHVPKTYLVRVPERLNPGQIEALEQGVDIGDDKATMPAKVEEVDAEHILLTIHEGRFHQVKRMLAAVGSQVLYLKRMTFGPLALDEQLEKGSYRQLKDEEIEQLKNCTDRNESIC